MNKEYKPVVCPWCGEEMAFRVNYHEQDEDEDMGRRCLGTYVCGKCDSTSPQIDTWECYVKEDAYAAAAARTPLVDENTSDGYHTFKELYHHRAVLFAALIAQMPEKAWKSKQHGDGTMYDGMFIVGIDTPDGQATYHYDIDPYWSMFCCRELDRAPEWDGHTPAQAIERIGRLAAVPPNRPLTLDQLDRMDSWDAVWVVVPSWMPGLASVTSALWGKTCSRDRAGRGTLFFARKPTPADIEAARNGG